MNKYCSNHTWPKLKGTRGGHATPVSCKLHVWMETSRKLVERPRLVTRSWVGDMTDQWRVSLYYGHANQYLIRVDSLLFFTISLSATSFPISSVLWHIPVLNLIGKSHAPQNKTSMKGPRICISYKLSYQNVMAKMEYSYTRTETVYNMEIEIVIFIVNRRVEMVVFLDRREKRRLRQDNIKMLKISQKIISIHIFKQKHTH